MNLETSDTVCKNFKEREDFLFQECEQVPLPEGKKMNEILIADLATPEKSILVYSLKGDCLNIIRAIENDTTRQQHLTFTLEQDSSVIIFRLTEEQVEILNQLSYDREKALAE